MLQNEFRANRRAPSWWRNGRDLRKLPLFQRKADLKKIVSGTDIQFSESFEVNDREMFVHVCKLGLEGVVAKVRDGV